MSRRSPCLWNRLPQSSHCPRDRYKHACCSLDGSVYILGGRDTSSLRDFWRYSVVCNDWTELGCTSDAAPEEIEGHSMVAHEGFLYVFGGRLDSAYSTWRCPLWIFDIAQQKWIHWPGKTSSPPMPTNRKGHSAVVVGSSMLLYGGFVDMKGSSQEFWSLDLESMSWSLLSGPQQGPQQGSQQGPLGPGPRHCHSAVAYQSCMYLFGGLKGLREQRDFWCWNSVSCTWTSLRSKSGPSKLMGHSAVTYKDSMLLFGGGESQNSPKNLLWRYSFTTHSWTQVANLQGSKAPHRIHHCCVGLGPSYRSGPGTDPGLQPRMLEEKLRPFKNKCFPVPLTFLGSEAIELQTFSCDELCESRTQKTAGSDKSREAVTEADAQRVGNCLTFENKAFRKQWSCTEEDLLIEEEEDEDISQHLPDLLLVLGGRPCSRHSPISVWQLTLTDS